MAHDETLLHAFLGGAVAVVAFFVPFSPVLGGAVAAYLNDGERAVRVGSIAGAIAFVPALLFGSLVLVFLGFGYTSVGFLAALLVVGLLDLLYTVGLGALGGYLGASLVDEL